MGIKVIYILSIIFMSAIVTVNSLQCYECKDCETVKDEYLQTCGPATTAAPTTVTTATPPTVTTNATTPSPNTTVTTTTTVTVPSTITNETTVTSPASNFLSYFKEHKVQPRADKYVCVVLKVKENGTDHYHRGCVYETGNLTACDVVPQNITCTRCDTDKCNSGVALHISVMLIISLIFLSFA